MATLIGLLKNKFVLGGIGVLAFIAIFYFGAKTIHDNIYESGVAYGKDQERQAYIAQQAKAKQEFDKLQSQADKDRQDLNKTISDLNKTNAELKKQLTVKQQNTKIQVKDYAKTNSGSMSCFAPNDDGLLIINKSFPTRIDR